MSSSSSTTTTSSSMTSINGMSITVSSTGTYFVIFSSYLTHTVGGATITIEIFVNNVAIPITSRIIIPYVGGIGLATAQDIPISINYIAQNVGNGQIIDVRWSTSSSTATCYNRTFDVIRIA